MGYGAREIIEYFSFDDHISRMDDPQTDLLFQVVKEFAEIDLTGITTMEIGYVFEELIRKFAEISNETAGEHFTPREVIKLMVNVLFKSDNDILTKEGIVKTLYDPACGTGGMLSVAEEYLVKLNPKAKLEVFGQEINPESYAICKSDMLIKGQNPANVKRWATPLRLTGLRVSISITCSPIRLLVWTGKKRKRLSSWKQKRRAMPGALALACLG